VASNTLQVYIRAGGFAYQTPRDSSYDFEVGSHGTGLTMRQEQRGTAAGKTRLIVGGTVITADKRSNHEPFRLDHRQAPAQRSAAPPSERSGPPPLTPDRTRERRDSHGCPPKCHSALGFGGLSESFFYVAGELRERGAARSRAGSFFQTRQ